MTRGELVSAAWLGFALACLFLSPLAFALDGNIYYLQWQPAHTAEVAVTLPAVAALLAALLLGAHRLRGLRGALALGAIAALPLISFGAAVARELPIARALTPLWEHPGVRSGAPGVPAAALIVALLAQPERFRRALLWVLQFLSPVSV